MADLNFYERVVQAQNTLKAPKSQFNSFSNFNYRNAEDILEAAKPINRENGLHLALSDEPIQVHDRVYIKATATLTDVYDPENKVVVTAYAREAPFKKGMDESQVTGAASSYARKYALNGLYLIDDTKDADTDEHQNQMNNAPNNNNYNNAPNNQPSEQEQFIANVNNIIDRMDKLAKISGQDRKKIMQVMLQRTNDETGNSDTKITKENIAEFNKHLRLAEVNFNKQQTKQQNQSQNNEQQSEQTSLMQGRTTNAIPWGQ